MRSELAQILLTYLPSKKGVFGSHPLADFVRNGVPVRIAKIAAISARYKVLGSAGQGNWAEIPWICIFDKEITNSAQTGYYIVYLFRADMRGVYLSLNQGWTQFRKYFDSSSEARKKIQDSSAMLRDVLNSCEGFDLEKIDLATSKTLGQGYEFGHICGKYYEMDSLPDDLSLVDDLRNLMGVYRELKGKLSGKPLIQELNEYHYERVNPYVAEGEKPTKVDYERVNKLLKDVESSSEINSLLRKFETVMEGHSPQIRQRIASVIVRNQRIGDLVKEEAGYKCALCKSPGFEKRGGGLYAEVHHVEELAGGGQDLPSNMICVCPTCHRKIHYGKEDNFVA